MNEKVQHDIDVLISDENDPERRALLIVLQAINRSLEENTLSTKQTQASVGALSSNLVAHIGNFDSHVLKEEALINRGRGAWAVLAFVLTVAQSIVLYGWNASRNEIESMKAEAHQSELIHQKLQSRIEQLEKS